MGGRRTSTKDHKADPSWGNPARPGWRKSTHSGAEGCCVEVAPVSVRVGVRDSGWPRSESILFGRPAWQGFLTSTRVRLMDWDRS
jgi:hypothetical protein